MKKLILNALIFIAVHAGVLAQVGINADNGTPDPSAMLDISSATRGVLFPRVALTSADIASPVQSPAVGLMVFNTAVAGAPPNDVKAGYYQWNGTRWVAVALPQGEFSGEMLYWNGMQWVKVTPGSNGQVLTFSNGIPEWEGVQLPMVSTMTVTSISSASATAGGNVIFDGGSNVTVRGICWSTSANPTVAGSHTTDGSGTGEFESQLAGLSPNTPYYYRAYATNGAGTVYGSEKNVTTLLSCGSLMINHVAGTVSPVTKSVTYGTVAGISGEPSKCWITANLGSDHTATAAGDASEASAGWYWQFNRKQGYKHSGTVRTPGTAWISGISESSAWLPANDPCSLELGAAWRIPTSSEWNNVDAAGNWVDLTSEWNSGLKLHAAGYLSNSSGSLYNRGSFGYYWSITQYSAAEGWYLSAGSGYSSMFYNYKAYGFSIRCLKQL